MTDRELITQLVAHLASTRPGLGVDSWPEDDEAALAPIDATAGPFAIEHTSVDTLPEQRLRSDWFMHAVGGLESELSRQLQCRLRITFDWDGVRKGQQWQAVREAVRDWIIFESPRLPEGKSVREPDSAIPMRLDIHKDSGRTHRLVFQRRACDDEQLSDRLRRQLDRKASKLKVFREAGFETLLLIETSDVLMSDGLMLESMQEAYRGDLPDGVDLIWLADTSVPAEVAFREITSFVRPTHS